MVDNNEKDFDLEELENLDKENEEEAEEEPVKEIITIEEEEIIDKKTKKPRKRKKIQREKEKKKEETPEKVLASIQVDKLKKIRDVLKATSQLPIRIYRRGVDGRSRFCETIYLSKEEELFKIEDYLMERGGGGIYELYLQLPHGNILKIRDVAIEGAPRPYKKARFEYEEQQEDSMKNANLTEERLKLLKDEIRQELDRRDFKWEMIMNKLTDAISKIGQTDSSKSDLERRLDRLETLIETKLSQPPQQQYDPAQLVRITAETLAQTQQRKEDPYQNAMLNMMNTLLAHVIQKTQSGSDLDIAKVKEIIEGFKSLQENLIVREPTKWETTLETIQKGLDVLTSLNQPQPSAISQNQLPSKFQRPKKRGRKPKLSKRKFQTEVNNLKKLIKSKADPSEPARRLIILNNILSRVPETGISELDLIRKGKDGIEEFLKNNIDDSEYITAILNHIPG